MTTPATIGQMLLVGGDPTLDFINTVDAWRDRWGPDLLTDYDDLIVWAGRIGLIDAALTAHLRRMAAQRPDAAGHALAQARALREGLHRIFVAEAHGHPPRQEDLDQLSAAAALAAQRRILRSENDEITWQWRDEADLDTILLRIAVAAAELLTHRGARRPVRECPGHNCGWLFIDTSRSGRRIWCAEETCGTRERVRRFRQAR